MRIIRNLSNARIETKFRGRSVIVPAKGTFEVSNDEESNARAKYLLETFGFLREEIIEKKYLPSEVKKAYGTKVRR